MGIFNDLLEEAKNEYASIADEGIDSGDITGHVDTGSYSLNALFSGSIYGGFPNNRQVALAGEPSTGKTFFAVNVVKQFLDNNPDAFVFYFESESAISKQMLSERNIDIKRIAVVPVATIQEFRTQAVKILDKYMETKEKNRPPMMFVLDSLGNLSTTKEIEDITSGAETRDMTRAQLIRGAFRVLTLKLGKARVPMIVTNHVYDVVGCALAGTLIRTPTIYKDISDIIVGDVVTTMVGDKKVLKTFQYETDEYFRIELEDGVIHQLTGEHKLMTQEGEWKKVCDLTEKDTIISI